MKRDQLKNRMKKFMAVVLAFLLAVSGLQISTGTAKASDTTEVTITSIGALTKHDSSTVRFTIVTSGDFTTAGTIAGFGDLVTLSGMGDVFNPTGHYGYANGTAGRLWMLYEGVSSDEVSSFPEGAKLTISAGTFQVGTTTYEIKSGISMIYQNGAWAEYVEPTEVTITTIGALTKHDSSTVRFTIVTSGDFTTAGTIAGFGDLVTLSGMGDAFNPTGHYGYANGTAGRLYMLYEGVSFAEVSSFPEGAKLTISPGTFKVGDTTYEIKTGVSMTYQSGAWVEDVETTEVTITGIGDLTQHNSSTVRFTIVTSGDFTTAGTIAGFGDLVTLSGMGDGFNPTGHYGYANGTAGRLYMLYEGVSSAEVSAFPEGAKLTISPGTFKVGDTTYEIKTGVSMTYQRGAWVEDVETTEVTITAVGTMSKLSNTQARFTIKTTGDFTTAGTIAGFEDLLTLSGMGDAFNPSSQYGFANGQAGQIWMFYEGEGVSSTTSFPEGAKLTISAGTFKVGDITYEIKSDITLTYRSEEWAEYKDISITSVSGLSMHDADTVKILLTTDTTFQSTGTIASILDLLTFEGMDFIIDNASGKYGFVDENTDTILLLFDGISINDVSTIPTGAKLTFKPGTIARGDAKYYLTNECTLIYNGESWQSEDEDIYFKWTNVWGDANADNTADVRDLIRVKKYIERGTKKVPVCLEGANVIADDAIINIDDLQELRLMLIGAPQLEMAAYDGPGYHHLTSTADT